MIRRFGFVVLVMALIVSACGRQVTPDRTGTGPGGLDPGFMSVKFRVKQPFNFAQYSYLVVFNTTGDGTTPVANGQQTNYKGYSFALIVEGTGGTAQVRAAQYYRPPGTPSFQQPVLLALNPTPQQLRLVTNSDGQNTEFTVVFDRHVFLGVATPTPGPSAGPTATPTPTLAGTWNFNYFVASGAQYTPVDSLGQNGPTDVSYQSPSLDTTQPFDTGAFYAAIHVAPPSDPSATIVGGDIASNP